MVAQNLTQRLKFTNSAVTIYGLLPKRMNYRDIGRVEIGRTAIKTGSGAGHMSVVNLISKQGKKLSLLPYSFAGYEGTEGWASTLLKIISENSVEVDPKVQQNLYHASQTQTYEPTFLAK
jgi:hypothetical protein